MSRLAVIVPVYNVEKLLPRCLDSILAQTYRDFTLILVNDGSTDGSGKICDGYAEKDERIRVIHKENGGVSSARNAGLDAADGEYITFIDSDDAIPPGYLETLYMAASGSGADVAICDVLFLSGDNARRRISCDRDFLSGKEAVELILSEVGINAGPYGKLFRRNIIGDLRFPPMKIYEDLIFNLSVFDRAESVVNCKTEYLYYDNPTGAMAGERKAPREDAILAAELTVQYLESNCGTFSGKPFYTASSRVMSYIYDFCDRPDSPEKKSFIDRAVKFFADNRREIRRCGAFPKKEKLLFLLASRGVLYRNGKLTKL